MVFDRLLHRKQPSSSPDKRVSNPKEKSFDATQTFQKLSQYFVGWHTAVAKSSNPHFQSTNSTFDKLFKGDSRKFHLFQAPDGHFTTSPVDEIPVAAIQMLLRGDSKVVNSIWPASFALDFFRWGRQYSFLPNEDVDSGLTDPVTGHHIHTLTFDHHAPIEHIGRRKQDDMQPHVWLRFSETWTDEQKEIHHQAYSIRYFEEPNGLIRASSEENFRDEKPISNEHALAVFEALNSIFSDVLNNGLPAPIIETDPKN